jgi:type II secretory pathway component PulF
LAAGIDARTCFQREADRARGTARIPLQLAAQRVVAGESLASALKASGDYFPPLVGEMIDVGEKTGRADQVFLRLADHYEHLLGLQRTFLSGIAWPVIQLSAALMIVGFLIWVMGFLQPGNREPVDLLGLGLMGNRGVVIYVSCLAVCAVIAGVMAEGLRRGQLGARHLIRAVLRIPVLGECLRTMALARMAWSLSLAVDAGMGARRSMRLAIESTNNTLYIGLIPAVDRVLQRRYPMHEALRNTGAFPDEFVEVVEVGEQSGQLSESLARLSAQYQERAAASSKVLTSLATFGTWAAVALIIVLLIFRLAMVYVNTINSLM